MTNEARRRVFIDGNEVCAYLLKLHIQGYLIRRKVFILSLNITVTAVFTRNLIVIHRFFRQEQHDASQRAHKPSKST